MDQTWTDCDTARLGALASRNMFGFIEGGGLDFWLPTAYPERDLNAARTDAGFSGAVLVDLLRSFELIPLGPFGAPSSPRKRPVPTMALVVGRAAGPVDQVAAGGGRIPSIANVISLGAC